MEFALLSTGTSHEVDVCTPGKGRVRIESAESSFEPSEAEELKTMA